MSQIQPRQIPNPPIQPFPSPSAPHRKSSFPPFQPTHSSAALSHRQSAATRSATSLVLESDAVSSSCQPLNLPRTRRHAGRAKAQPRQPLFQRKSTLGNKEGILKAARLSARFTGRMLRRAQRRHHSPSCEAVCKAQFTAQARTPTRGGVLCAVRDHFYSNFFAGNNSPAIHKYHTPIGYCQL